jgi:hypothetical protein
MEADLHPIETALAALTDAELHAWIDATRGVPQIAPGLLAWIDGACKWELNRRAGREYELLPPEVAIDHSEDAVSIDATHAMRAMFGASGSAPAALKFFDALVALLTGGGRKH